MNSIREEVPEGFPALDDLVEVNWAPITLCPTLDSPERLVIAVAAIGADGFHLEQANSLSKLQCLYGNSALYLENMCSTAFTKLNQVMQDEGRSALKEGAFLFSNVRIEAPRLGEGESPHEVARLWLKTLSSLYSSAPDNEGLIAEEILDEAPPVPTREKEEDRFREIIIDEVKRVKPDLIGNFSAMMTGRRQRRSGAAAVEIDYAGANLVANFGTLQTGANTKTINLIKRKIFDLTIQRDKKNGLAKDINHELIVYRPPFSDPKVSRVSLNRIQDAVGDLSDQSMKTGISFVPLESVPSIGAHVVEVESASKQLM